MKLKYIFYILLPHLIYYNQRYNKAFLNTILLWNNNKIDQVSIVNMVIARK